MFRGKIFIGVTLFIIKKMVVKIKNPALRKRVFKQMDSYDAKASKCYKKGDMECGNKWEKKSNEMYDKNYYKMFKVTKSFKAPKY